MSTVEPPLATPESRVTSLAGEAQIPPDPAHARNRGFREWLWRTAALAEAERATGADFDAALVQQARECVELADRLTAQIDGLESGSGLGTAILLYRDALILTVESYRGAATADDLEHRAHRLLGPSVSEETTRGTAALLGATPAVIARSSEEERAVRAQASRAVLRFAMDAVDAKSRLRSRVLGQRAVRTGTLVVLVLGLLSATAVFIPPLLRPANLLAHSPWHASSSYPGFTPGDKTSTGKPMEIFFHTDEENNPSIQFDMGKVQTVHHFEIKNRTDCCDDRALPLVIKTSVDGKQFEEVARRKEPFKTFDVDVPPKPVRFVKVYAAKKTYLHLERVAAW
jgi:hypothetical protein